MEKRRSSAQDIAKGILIVGVIFFHCYVATFENTADFLSDFNYLVAFFPFLLSTFFFYAGYNYTPNSRSFKENVARRAKQLLIPFVMAFAISAVLISSMELAFQYQNPGATFHAIGNSLLYSLMSEPLALLIGFPKEGGTVFELRLALCLLWFLYALFICSVFFYLLVKRTNKKLSTLISVVSALLILGFCLGHFVGVYLPYHVEAYPNILAIMLVAAYLRQSNFLDKPITCKKDAVFPIINAVIAEGIIIGTSLMLHNLYGTMTAGAFPGGQFDAAIKGFDAFVTFFYGLLGVYFIHMLSRAISCIPVISQCLQWMGKRSAIFYLFHPIFLELSAIVIFQKKIPWGRGQAFFYTAVVVALLILVCLLIDLLTKKLGKKKKAVMPQEEGTADEK
ncbi:MAG: acyltransferase [Bacilli bacterium]|nr:acyltransferase [Bacilli bacterium]